MARLENMAEGNISAEITPTGGHAAREGNIPIDPLTGQSVRRDFDLVDRGRRFLRLGGSQPPAGGPPPEEPIQDFGDPDEGEPVRPAAPQPTTTPPAVPPPEAVQPAQPDAAGQPDNTAQVAASGAEEDAEQASFDERALQRWEYEGGAPEGPRGPESPASGEGEGGWPPRGYERLLEPEPEFEHSPERGRWLVEELMYWDAEVPYEVTYDGGRKERLVNELYSELKKFVEAEQQDRNAETPLDLEKKHKVEHKKGHQFIDEVIKSYEAMIIGGVTPGEDEEAYPPEDLTSVAPLEQLITRYNNARSPDARVRAAAYAELPVIQEALLMYFRQAKRKDLLRGVDAIINSIYSTFKSGSYPLHQIVEQADHTTIPTIEDRDNPNYRPPQAYLTAESDLMSRVRSGDREVGRLFGVWEPYLRFARERLGQEFNGVPWEPEEGEWRPSREGDRGHKKETYWKPYGGYPNYYTVSAEIPEQFRIAMETFLQMIRNKALGFAPDDLMQHIQNFQQQLSGEATRLAEQQVDAEDGPNKMTTAFATEIRQELQARSFLWYTFYQYEHYNKENAKNGATAMAMHEGPKRWARAYRSQAGEVAAHTRAYDTLPMITLALHAEGRRGQLSEYTPGQEYIRNMIFRIRKEHGMGVVLRDYDHRDTALAASPEARLLYYSRLQQLEVYLAQHNNRLDSLSKENKDFYTDAKKAARTNNERLGLHMSEEEFRTYYEGAIYGDAHIKNYEAYIKRYASGEDKNKLREEIAKLPKKLQDSVRLGMMQKAVEELRQKIRRGEAVLDRGDDSIAEQAIDKLVKNGLIPKKEKKRYLRIYNDAYARSVAAFELAQQMEGVSHESTLRGGGVYFITKNEYVRAYKAFRQTDRKRRKAADADIHEWTVEQKKQYFIKRKVDGTVNEDVYLGWILDEIRKGRKEDSFTHPYERELLRRLSPEQRENKVDYLPVDLAEAAGNAAVNWVRVEYGDDAEIWQRSEFKSIIEATDKNGNYLYPNFRAMFRSAVIEDIINRTADEIMSKGYQAKLRCVTEYDFDLKAFYPKKKEKKTEKKLIWDKAGSTLEVMTEKKPHIFGYTQLGIPIIAFDKDWKPVLGYDKKGNPVYLTPADYDERGQPIIYDWPYDYNTSKNNEGGFIKGRQRIPLDRSGYTFVERQDRLNVGKKSQKRVVYVSPEEVKLDFQQAVASWLALKTSHTYWAYQSNNTHTLIPEYVFKQAQQIRDGLIRREDADILAGLLLTLDPTLKRVKSMPGALMSVETAIFDTAVEESFIGSVNVKRALRKKALPGDGNFEFIDIGYFTEDQGGDIGFSMNAVARIAKMPKRWARRFAGALAGIIPEYGDSMAKMLGERGVSGAIAMTADPIDELTGQPIMGQFAHTKFINLTDAGTELWFRLVGGTDPKEGNHHEGLLMKPTNNAERLMKFYTAIRQARAKAGGELEILNGFLESFGRVWDTLKIIRTMYSDVRNAGGALHLEKTDIILPNGRINPQISVEKDRNTGTSREIAKQFWHTYVEWLLDTGPAGGAQAYPDAYAAYQFLYEPFKLYNTETGQFEADPKGRTWAGWLFDKMVL